MILGVAGYQGSGKTTLVELVVPRIVEAGFAVATVKHVAHGDLRVDAGATDTERHKRAGARAAVAVSDEETVYFHTAAHSLEQVLERLALLDEFDLVLVEGFKASPLPKVVVGDVEHGGPARFRWDGTVPHAARIAEEIMGELRAERMRKRAPGGPRRHPGARRGRASARSAVRRRRTRGAGRRGR
ncbi:MAG TPA: molybdopterin-guanine dinucleotide biosynthesis protein B [Candidatus Thermoplasmatota archaeon]